MALGATAGLPIFAVFGITGLSVKAAASVWALATVVVGVLFLDRAIGRRAAVLGASPSSIRAVLRGLLPGRAASPWDVSPAVILVGMGAFYLLAWPPPGATRRSADLRPRCR